MDSPSEYRWPCSQCGSELRYSPGQRELTCDHCGHRQELPEVGRELRDVALKEHPLARGLAKDLPPEAIETVRSSRCPNCGALIEFSGATHATECPFCATPVVTDTDESRKIKPQALIPFAVDERTARAALVKWLGRLWFAPNGLLAYTRRGRAMAGTYVPHWTFDAATRSSYRGERGDVYYVTREVTINGKRQTRQERRVRWTPAAGAVARDFDDVLVNGSTSVPRRLVNAMKSWQLGALVPYGPDYLAGFSSEGYTVGLAEANEAAKKLMAEVIDRDVRADIGGDTQRVHSIDTRYSGETFKHVLLPLWLAAYKYSGKSYRFVVNGQTGEVQGERPWSLWKITFAVIGAIIVIAVAAWLWQENGGGF